jgi:hypothetical protein
MYKFARNGESLQSSPSPSCYSPAAIDSLQATTVEHDAYYIFFTCHPDAANCTAAQVRCLLPCMHIHCLTCTCADWEAHALAGIHIHAPFPVLARPHLHAPHLSSEAKQLPEAHDHQPSSLLQISDLLHALLLLLLACTPH